MTNKPQRKTPPQVLRLERQLEGLANRTEKLLSTLKKCIIRDYEKIKKHKRKKDLLIQTQDRLIAEIDDVRITSEAGMGYAIDQYCNLCNDRRTLKCQQCFLYSFLKTGHKWKKGLDSERLGFDMEGFKTAKYKGG